MVSSKECGREIRKIAWVGRGGVGKAPLCRTIQVTDREGVHRVRKIDVQPPAM